MHIHIKRIKKKYLRIEIKEEQNHILFGMHTAEHNPL